MNEILNLPSLFKHDFFQLQKSLITKKKAQKQDEKIRGSQKREKAHRIIQDYQLIPRIERHKLNAESKLKMEDE